MFVLSILFVIMFLGFLIFFFFISEKEKWIAKAGVGVSALLAVVSFLWSCTTSVSPVSVGIVTSFGKIIGTPLPSGIHLIAPWEKVTEIYLGQQVAGINNDGAPANHASSKDLQSVHSDLVVNFTVTDSLALYKINPTLTYGEIIVLPAIKEVFKSVVARYTAEELITKRQQVSNEVTEELRTRLAPFYLNVQTVNLTNFGFSKAFDEAIEAKVTAIQKAETAKNDLERVKNEANSRVAQATGEAEAIRIQSDAVVKNGGDAYLKLRAIEKWDGQLPQYIGGGEAMPLLNMTGNKSDIERLSQTVNDSK